MTITPIAPLPRDLRQAASTLGREEARYLVDTYYQMQEFRKATANQVRSVEDEEPHETLAFFANQFEQLEEQIKKALDSYSASEPLGHWARSHIGVGPVIAAGLLAHIDISRARTAGAIWRYAGLDPSSEWKKGEQRPWNAQLKVLCWKLGDSFVKQSGKESCFYGHLYRQRKEFELTRDQAGGNAEAAKRKLEEFKIRDKATKATYEDGHLPDGRLDLRARRWAVKIFLAHYFEEGYRQLHGEEPPLPYPIAHLGHVHKINAP